MLSTLLITMLLSIFISTNTTWVFDGEDYGTVLRGALIKTPKDILTTFKHGHVGPTHLISSDNPHGLPHTDAHFASAYYRPLYILFYKLQYLLFGGNAYGYFLIFLLLHTLITLLIFSQLTQLTSLSIAFFTALFFSFHPILYGWMGKIDMQQLLLATALALVSLKLLAMKHSRYTLLGCFIYLASLLTRETYLALPFILLFLHYALPEKTQLQKTFFVQSKKVIALLFCITLIYFSLRLYAYPLAQSTQQGSGIYPLLSGFAIKINDMVRSFFWLQCFPWNTYLKAQAWGQVTCYNVIRTLLALGTLVSFMLSKQKRTIIVFSLAGAALCWPMLLTKYAAIRFYYEALPLFMIVVALLISSLTRYSQLFITPVVVLTACNAISIISCMHTITQFPRQLAHGLLALKQNNIPLRKKIALKGVPSKHAVTGMKPALELLGISKQPTTVTVVLEKEKIEKEATILTWQEKSSTFFTKE